MNNSPTVLWFRTDLRLADNPALAAAVHAGAPLIALYIVDTGPARRAMGGASRWWLDGSLRALDASLRTHGHRLTLLAGDPHALLPALVRATGAGAVFWNRRYGRAETALDAGLKAQFRAEGRLARSFNSHLLNEPWEVTSGAGTPMKVFTPFWRAARARGPFAPPLPMPAGLAALPACDGPLSGAVEIDALALKPVAPDWASGFAPHWTPGEAGAIAALHGFVDGALKGYADTRDRPDLAFTSRLSPHLAFGEIGPRQIAATIAMAEATTPGIERDAAKFMAEVGWREFAYHLLGQTPDMAEVPINAGFAGFPWKSDARALRAWQRGMTGYPIVDAGMRQLWQTGWMHNRVRMIVASFLIKHLLVDWREGERWFWDTLLDADPANNAASWQWVAGCGADAAPYYRIFNPMLQGAKFDPAGDYVRRYVPELAGLPAEHIHAPWQAPATVLTEAGVALGKSYPLPLVDHAAARARALDAYRDMRDGARDSANASSRT